MNSFVVSHAATRFSNSGTRHGFRHLGGQYSYYLGATNQAFARDTQAISRAYFMAQVRNVMVHRFLCANTIDQRMNEIPKTKQLEFDICARRGSIRGASFAILLIAEDPYVGNPKRGDLSGIYGYDLYYAKTDYEIACRIVERKNKEVVVALAGTRGDFYQQLKHYLDEGNTKLMR